MAIHKLFDGADEAPFKTPFETSFAGRSHFQSTFTSTSHSGANPEGADLLDALRLRCLLLLGSLVALIWAAVATTLTIASLLAGTVLLAISLGTKRSALRFTRRCWRHVRLAAACSLGCAVSLFSLKFGLTVLAIYFLLRSEDHKGQGVMGYVCQQVNEAFSRFGVS